MSKFKVGDRVRAVRTDYPDSIGVGAVTTVTRVDEDGDAWLGANGGQELFFFDSELEPFCIESGKSYRTSDGRKVGPMVKYFCPDSYGKDQFVVVFGDGKIWSCSGKGGNNDSPDIISEWTDEPNYSGNPAAEVDNQRAEYGPIACEPKFKVGDRVKFRDDYGSRAAGTEAKVVSVDSWGIMVEGVYGTSTESPYSLRPIAPTAPTSPAIVALIERGVPRPATRPFVHANRASAEREAARLAGVHRGKEFGVYEFVSSAREAKLYDHEWQRLAADGEKLGAIKALRHLAGLSLATAKEAIEDWIDREAA